MAVSCATAPKQTDALLASPLDIAPQVELKSVPFIKQEANYCGPASLAMVMNHAGLKVNIKEMAEKSYTPGQTGTLQADMMGAVRRHGMLAVQVRGMAPLLMELAAQRPVLVLQNLAFAAIPQWHYAVAIGYDLPRAEVILHSGPKKAERMKLRNFEPTWQLASFWGMVVLKPGELSVTGSETDHTIAAAALENLNFLSQAEKSYRAVLSRWPTGLTALLGLGNIAYARKNYALAVTHLKRAAELHPANDIVWHNLAVAQGSAGQRAAAQASAQKALELSPNQETRAQYRQELKEWL